MDLLLPVAGQSSRFPGMRPKHLLTLPSGKLMIEACLDGLPIDQISRIVIGARSEHLSTYISASALRDLMEERFNTPVSVIEIESSSSQPMTCSILLDEAQVSGSFAIKDCDNSFTVSQLAPNSIAYVSLNNPSLHTLDAPSGKSYISIDSLSEVLSICEKKVISPNFCCGLYAFASPDLFQSATRRLADYLHEHHHDRAEVYVSHVIQELIASGVSFVALPASDYADFGTERGFRAVCSRAITLFCDFDGVLVLNSSKFDSPPWQMNPITANLECLRDSLLESPESRLVITTSRPSELREGIEAFLLSYGIRAHCIVTDLPHCHRRLINDFSRTNPYPSCSAVSVARDSDSLSDYL